MIGARRIAIVLLLAGFALCSPAFAQDVAETPAAMHEGKTAGEWLELLDSETAMERKQAAYGLWTLAPEIDGAAKPLARALRDEDAYVRGVAAKALVKLREKAAPACAEIATALFSERQEVRREAATLLWRMGLFAAPAAADLTHALRSEDAVVRANAAAALGQQTRDTGKQAVPQLVRLLEDESEDVRKWVVIALARLAPLEVLAHEEDWVRIKALSTQSMLFDKDPDVLAAIAKSLSDDNDEVRRWAAAGFMLPGVVDAAPDRDAVIDGLIGVLSCKDPLARIQAVQALAFAREPAARIAPAVISRLDDESPEVALSAVRCLGWLGQSGAPAVERLLAFVASENADFRGGAAYALGLVGDGSESIRAAVTPLLEAPSPSVRSFTASGLAAMGPAASEAVPFLVKRLAVEDDLGATRAILRALGEIGSPTKECVDALERRFADESTRERYGATALCKLGAPSAEAALRFLVDEAFKNGTASGVYSHLVSLGERARPAIQWLSDGLGSEDAMRREGAAHALGAIAVVGDEAIMAALERTRDTDASENVRSAATWALDAVRRRAAE